MVTAPVVQSSYQRGEQVKKMVSSSSSSAQNVNNIWETMLQDAMRRNRLPDGTLLLVGPQGCGKSSLLDNFLEGSAASANPSGGAAALAAAGPAAVAPLVEKVPEGAAPAAGTAAGAVSAAAGVGTTAASDTVGAANVRGFHPVLAYSYLDAADLSEQGLERDDSPPRISVWCCSELEFEDLLQTVMRPEQLANTAAVVAVDLSRPWEVMDSVKKWTAVVERHMTRLLSQVPRTTLFDLQKAVKERLKAARAGGEGEDNDHLDGGLGEGFLERNIGIPLVVVGCKADSLQSETFEQQQRLHFIQQSLRRFCLQYGAALVYTSAKDGVNCGLLHRYLLSCLYPDAFPCSDEGQTSDAVFIPAGWDSKRLIEDLLSPDKTPWGPEATFSEVVVPPPGVERREGASEKRGSWGKGGSAEAGEEKVDMVEPEGNWLSNLSKQFIDEKPTPSEIIRRPKSRSESKSPRVSTKGDPKSFFANLLANPNRPSRSPQG